MDPRSDLEITPLVTLRSTVLVHAHRDEPHRHAVGWHSGRGHRRGPCACTRATSGPDHAARLLPPQPGVPYLITESVGVVKPKPRHYRWTDRPAVLARQAALHVQVHDIAGSDARYAGLLAWAAFDYASLQGRGGEHIKWAGVADGFRLAKPAAALYRSQVDPRIRPVIARADDTVITGDGCDATRVVFGVLDAHGNQRRSGTGKVTLRAEGPARLIGDNPFPLGRYGGAGAVWLRSRPGQPGPVTVTADHPGLGHAQIQVTIAPDLSQRMA
jgi:hypothetical protein